MNWLQHLKLDTLVGAILQDRGKRSSVASVARRAKDASNLRATAVRLAESMRGWELNRLGSSPRSAPYLLGGHG